MSRGPLCPCGALRTKRLPTYLLIRSGTTHIDAVNLNTEPCAVRISPPVLPTLPSLQAPTVSLVSPAGGVLPGRTAPSLDPPSVPPALPTPSVLQTPPPACPGAFEGRGHSGGGGASRGIGRKGVGDRRGRRGSVGQGGEGGAGGEAGQEAKGCCVGATTGGN